MSRALPERDAADASSSGVAQILRSFFAMAIEEWRKLVSDVVRAFGGKLDHPADAIEEKRFGDVLAIALFSRAFQNEHDFRFLSMRCRIGVSPR